jgi:Tol biopolymer transport system component
VWVDRQGRQSLVDSTWFGSFNHVVLSPDGSHMAVTIASNDGDAVWVKKLPEGSLTRLTPDGPSDRPVWLPDGRSVAYLATRNSKRTSFISRADGSIGEQPLNKSRQSLDEVTFAPDGRSIIYRTEGTTVNTRKLFYAPNNPDSVPRPLLRTPYDNFGATISPNGKWMACVSTESKQNQVYVRPYPSVDSARWTISINGGSEPLWAHNGRELFFRTQEGTLMSVPVETSGQFRAGTPVKLFSDPALLLDEYHRGYDIDASDKRFLMVRTSLRGSQLLGLVMNWGSQVSKLTAKR